MAVDITFTRSQQLCFAAFESKGCDSEFETFQPLASTYHYRDPLVYAEMRNIIGTQEMKQVAQCLKDCLCYSVQTVGSDKQQVDSKSITTRYVPFNEVSVNTVFLGIASSELGGAEGLLDSFKSCVERAAVQTNNLVGITTDGGENANRGKNTGLWRLLQRYLGKDILSVYMVCVSSI